MGLVFPNEHEEDSWIYWERNPDLIKKIPRLVKTDHDKRIEKHLKSDDE